MNAHAGQTSPTKILALGLAEADYEDNVSKDGSFFVGKRNGVFYWQKEYYGLQLGHNRRYDNVLSVSYMTSIFFHSYRYASGVIYFCLY